MKSILFSAPMILALRDGKKTVTRRLKTKLKAGDLVYVKEAWRSIVEDDIPYPRNHDWRDELPL